MLGAFHPSRLLVLRGLKDLINNVLHQYRGPPPLYVHWSDLLDLLIIRLQRDELTFGNSCFDLLKGQTRYCCKFNPEACC